MGGRKLFGQQRPGGGWVVLYPDDLFDIDPAWSVYGQRRGILHSLWTAGRTGTA